MSDPNPDIFHNPNMGIILINCNVGMVLDMYQRKNIEMFLTISEKVKNIQPAHWFKSYNFAFLTVVLKMSITKSKNFLVNSNRNVFLALQGAL